MNKTIIKGHKIRIYPNKEQRILIEKHFGCCRFIWNYMLNLQNKLYKETGKHYRVFDTIKLVNNIKQQESYNWLYEVSNASLQEICRDLDKAFNRFFNKISNYPKFKSKKTDTKSYPVRDDRFYFKTKKLLKIEKLGLIKYKTDLNFELNISKFKNVRLSKEGNKYYISFVLEYENQVPELNDYKLGIDLGVKELAVCFCTNNESYFFENINKSEKMKKLFNEVKLLQRSIMRKYRQNKQGDKFIRTKNILKEMKRLQKVYRKISNIKADYIHKTTRKLVNLLPQEIIVEDLHISNLIRNNKISNALFQQNLFMFKNLLSYKAEWQGIKFTIADRFYPSSKTCSKCGYIKKDLKLKDRIYKCNECDLILDRDLNAAINLANYTT